MRKVIYLGIAIVLLSNCKKDDPEIIIKPIEIEEDTYLPLAIGNYWVYEHYEIDTLGNEKKIDQVDSIIISRDTFINGKQYFIRVGTNYPEETGKSRIVDIIRDSAEYLVNEKGEIKFSANNFTDILATKTAIVNDDTASVLTYQMVKHADPVIVPAGQFDVLNFQATLDAHWMNPRLKKPIYLNNLYAKNVGQVLSSFIWIGRTLRDERRLVRYHIEK